MKVVMVNNYFYLRGGCERVMFNDMQALEAEGVEVIPFSSTDEENFETPYSKFFAPGADIRATSPVKRIGAAMDAISCRRTADAFGKLLDTVRPDVVHCHNVYGRLSTAILPIAQKRGIPVVLTTHDYKVVCPSYLMLRDGKPCTACLDGGYYRCAVNRCHKGQTAASMVYTIEAYNAKYSGNYNAVSAFLAPSRFIADLLRKSGIADNRVIYHPNSVEPAAYQPSYTGDYVLSVGRLSHEKGLPTLLKALVGTGLPVRVAGTGPMESELRSLAERDGGAITLEGHCGGAKLAELYRNAAFVVVPSEWYENAPMSILESFAYGKSVIGTKIGGIPELITEGKTGHLVDAGSTEQLRAKVKELWMNRHAQTEMGRNARHLIETRFAQSTRTASLLQIYASMRQKQAFVPVGAQSLLESSSV